MYDQTMYDSYVTLETEDLISVGAVWTEDSSATARSVFSDAETVTVMANVSNPFGAYEIVGATAEVAFSGNGTTVVPSTAMALDVLDPSAVPYWAEFSLDLNGLASGDYIINVTAYDPQGAPTWLDAAFSVVSADHFGVTLPESVTAGVEFSMTVAALNASGSVITDWVGTVSLAAFLPDMITPGAGSLNISSVQITVADLGQVVVTDQTYSYAEETIVVRAYAGVHEGWSSSMEVRAGPVVSVQIAPAGLIDVPAGGSQMFTAVGTDALGNTNTTWQPNWTLDGTAGSISGSGLTITFTASTAGTANLTCKDDESNASASVEITVVAGSLASMSVVPAGPLTIREGQSQTLTAYGYDSEGNPVPITGAVWSTDTSGSVVGTGPSAVYTAGFIPEEGSVEVAVGATRATVDITVINALNGPWLSTITDADRDRGQQLDFQPHDLLAPHERHLGPQMVRRGRGHIALHRAPRPGLRGAHEVPHPARRLRGRHLPPVGQGPRRLLGLPGRPGEHPVGQRQAEVREQSPDGALRDLRPDVHVRIHLLCQGRRHPEDRPGDGVELG